MAISQRVGRLNIHVELKAFRTCRDVAYEAYKAHHRGPSPMEAANFSEPTRLGIVAVQRATFQSIASMYVGSYSPSYPDPYTTF